MRRKITALGQAGVIQIMPDELKALGLKVGDEVNVSSVGGLMQITPVDKYENLKLDDLFALVDVDDFR